MTAYYQISNAYNVSYDLPALGLLSQRISFVS